MQPRSEGGGLAGSKTTGAPEIAVPFAAIDGTFDHLRVVDRLLADAVAQLETALELAPLAFGHLFSKGFFTVVSLIKPHAHRTEQRSNALPEDSSSIPS